MTIVNAATTTAAREDLAPSENSSAIPAQVRLTRQSPAYWRVTIDNPPVNVMGPEMVGEFQEVINAIEADQHVRVLAARGTTHRKSLMTSAAPRSSKFSWASFGSPDAVLTSL